MKAPLGPVGFVVLLAAGPVLAAGASPASSPAEIDQVVAALKVNADRWWNDEPVEPAAELALKGLWFDASNVAHLTNVLRGTPKDPNGLYVINRLLRQLSFARRPTIRAMLPEAKAMQSRLGGTYQRFPALSKAQLASLKRPAHNTPRGRAALEKRRREKLRREKIIAKRNEMIWILEARTFLLMLRAEQPQEDRRLAEMLVEAEKKRSAIFLAILDSFASEARKMVPERAREVYDVLRPHALEVKMEGRRGYVHYGKATLKATDRSEFATVVVYPGIRILKALNRIATAARMPALKVPKPKDVEKHRARRHKRRR